MLWIKATDRTATFRALLRLRAYSTRGVGVTPEVETNPRDNHTLSASEHHSTVRTHATGPVPERTREQSSPNSSLPMDLEAVRLRLKDWSTLASSSLRRHADELSNKATTTFSHLGLHLNRVTGYEEIEALKRRVVEQEARIKATRRAARDAKTAHDDAVLQRSISQREVNDLLQRKSTWTDSDVSQFTALVRADHSFEQEEAHTKTRVAETEDAVDREFSELMRVILARYHEEQVWSDKIRSASTYGSLAVLGVNVVVFIMAIIVVEPWKRKRLAQTFEKKVEELGAETKAAMNAGATRLEERLTTHERLLTELVNQAFAAEARQRPFATETIPEKVLQEEPPEVLPPASSWWSEEYLSSLHVDGVPARELALVAGSAAIGGLITLLTRSIFAK